ncbi:MULTISPECIES: BN159_2729 family protein [Streptomyces]|uniref:BN159_2729 family protein n=1 Tax=Streptomyces TaxID=1883 RepID=UPI00068C03E0|nr:MULTISPECIES: BN159_2729 family protein [Streptomyces]
MNKNLPHAVRVIRAALASTGSDPAAAIAHALNDARLLVDPERSFGRVLYRTPAGGWSDRPQPKAELTDLEQQALAWDESCERARQVAAAIEAQIGQHREFQNVQVDKDRVLVALHITDQAQWAQWRQYFGITHAQEQSLPYAVAGDGYRDGVRVSVVAYDLPQVQARAARSAKRPFQLGGVVYDLALPQQDSEGDIWFFQGQRSDDGMPMLSVDGRPERCSLANIVTQVGPLTPVTDVATPVTAQGGEVA